MGALFTGIFATSVINPIFKDANGNVFPSGLIEGNGHQLLNQLVGVAIAWVVIVGTLILLTMVDNDWACGLRRQKIEGLDVTQHGEEGYYWKPPPSA